VNALQMRGPTSPRTVIGPRLSFALLAVTFKISSAVVALRTSTETIDDMIKPGRGVNKVSADAALVDKLPCPGPAQYIEHAWKASILRRDVCKHRPRVVLLHATGTRGSVGSGRSVSGDWRAKGAMLTVGFLVAAGGQALVSRAEERQSNRVCRSAGLLPRRANACAGRSDNSDACMLGRDALAGDASFGLVVEKFPRPKGGAALIPTKLLKRQSSHF
jgi:hypothetical protein